MTGLVSKLVLCCYLGKFICVGYVVFIVLEANIIFFELNCKLMLLDL
jgi:hypothetical protein